MKFTQVNLVEVRDWDNVVKKTYGRPYSFQQQNGCQSRGIVKLSVPSLREYDEYMNEEIPEEVNGDVMGVKFDVWLSRDPNIHNFKEDYSNGTFWERNFYPDLYTVANDLYKKGILEKGEYIINIDW